MFFDISLYINVILCNIICNNERGSLKIDQRFYNFFIILFSSWKIYRIHLIYYQLTLNG